MAEKMMQYILEQPGVWRHIIAERERLLAEINRMPATHKRVLLVGSGSSYNAGWCAKTFFEEALGLETDVVTPSSVGGKAKLLPPKETLVLVVSQSGRSTNTIAAVAKLQAAGFTVCVVCAKEKAPLAGAAGQSVFVACGEETVGPKTKGMTATVLTLYLIGIAYARKRGALPLTKEAELLGALAACCDAAPENIQQSILFCQTHMETLAAQPHFTLIAEGAGVPSAAEDALKILETLYVPAFAYEFEEYMHGVNNTIAPGCCNFFIPTENSQIARMMRLEQYSSARGCINFVVGTHSPEKKENVLALKGTGVPYCAPFETMLFFQIVSAMVSAHKGIDCDKPKFPDFYEVMNTKV